jgi:alanine transaminase
VLLADEVYQENVYEGEFYSCKKAAGDLGLLDRAELVSFHSVSKGVFGECGRRGGYMELSGIDGAVRDQLYKLASSSLCSTVTGQIMTALMARGPEPGDESYDTHEAEKQAIYQSLKRRAAIVSKGLDQIDGFSCQPARGSMYCFPSVWMPPKAIAVARHNGVSVDTLYCKSLLNRTGICVVPASGFGQRGGRFGFRTTFLPQEQEMQRCVNLFRQHYSEFLHEYS